MDFHSLCPQAVPDQGSPQAVPDQGHAERRRCPSQTSKKRTKPTESPAADVNDVSGQRCISPPPRVDLRLSKEVKQPAATCPFQLLTPVGPDSFSLERSTFARGPRYDCQLREGRLEIFKTSQDGRRVVDRLSLFWARVWRMQDSAGDLVGYDGRPIRLDTIIKISPAGGIKEPWIFFCPRQAVSHVLEACMRNGCIYDEEITGLFAIGDSFANGAYGSIKRAERGNVVMVVKHAAESSIKREVRMLTLIGSHPCIIRYRGTFEDPDRDRYMYMALDFHSHGDMWYYAATNRGLQCGQALSFLRDLLSALAHIHKLGIFHRDVKPENLLVKNAEHCVLCDFGISTKVHEPNYSRALSKEYASPEMVKNQSNSVLGDVFGAGATFHFMMTLKYVSNSIVKPRKFFIQLGTFKLCFDKLLADLPETVKDLMNGMVCAESKRSSAAEALLHPAFQIIEPDEEVHSSQEPKTAASAVGKTGQTQATGVAAKPPAQAAKGYAQGDAKAQAGLKGSAAVRKKDRSLAARGSSMMSRIVGLVGRRKTAPVNPAQ
eukprot:gb/GFBE01018486.1/.p1 GENE.gb/GFBE01018486.1/~~gb/GFBE01018486.1/.p1  ORF type:complete len:547 (+),score=63.14 gb/GFBE01018486.1/:1-1641(+)